MINEPSPANTNVAFPSSLNLRIATIRKGGLCWAGRGWTSIKWRGQGGRRQGRAVQCRARQRSAAAQPSAAAQRPPLSVHGLWRVLPRKLGVARAGRRVHVVNLQHHLHQLCCQANLLLLANERLQHVLVFHVCKRKRAKGTRAGRRRNVRPARRRRRRRVAPRKREKKKKKRPAIRASKRTVGAALVAVHAETRVALVHLPGLDVRHWGKKKEEWPNGHNESEPR